MKLTKDNAFVGAKIVINDNIGHYDRFFTKGKEYIIDYIDDNLVGVYDDNGLVRDLYYDRFNLVLKDMIYLVCVKPTLLIRKNQSFVLHKIVKRNDKYLINGRWVSASRFIISDVKPEIKFDKSVAQELQKAQANKGRIGTCSYAIGLEDGHIVFQVNDICHARIRPKKRNSIPVAVSLMVSAHIERIKNAEEDLSEEVLNYKKVIDYILNRSPWASVFTNTDYENNFGCVDMDVERGVNAIASAAIALRTASEFQTSNRVFVSLIEAGINEDVAYIITHQCQGNIVGMFSGNHHIFSNCVTISTLVSFFKTGKFIDEGPKYNTIKSLCDYIVIKSMFHENYELPDTVGKWLIKASDDIETIVENKNPWGGVRLNWTHPNNLIPLAYKFEKELYA